MCGKRGILDVATACVVFHVYRHDEGLIEQGVEGDVLGFAVAYDVEIEGGVYFASGSDHEIEDCGLIDSVGIVQAEYMNSGRE